MQADPTAENHHFRIDQHVQTGERSRHVFRQTGDEVFRPNLIGGRRSEYGFGITLQATITSGFGEAERLRGIARAALPDLFGD